MDVTGYLLSLITTGLIATDLLVQLINHSIVFLKDRDILSDDAWHVAIDLNTDAYKDVLSTIRGDLVLVDKQKQEFTSLYELRQIEALLNTLEDKLYNFQQILPKLDSQRSLISLRGTVLKALFGTAMIADVHQLHKTLDNLQSRNSDIVHSLADQVIYIKK